jgi:hypothetical protein
MDACECIVLKVDETDGRLWQIAELLRQPKLSPLDWAELVMEWVRLVREKGARVGHPVGGPQPHDKGFSEAERVLGVSRTEVQRAEQIVGISDAGKAEIRRLNLRVKRDILKIRKAPDDEQVAMVRQLAGPKPRTVVVRGAAQPEDSESAAVPEHKPAPPLAEVPKQAEEPTQAEEPMGAEEEPEGQEGGLMDSPSTTPPEIVDPPERPAGTDREKQYAAFKSRWVQDFEADFKALPAAMQARFAAELPSMAALATGKGEGPR